jgi:regulator of nucleoside diphosphate kinase
VKVVVSPGSQVVPPFHGKLVITEFDRRRLAWLFQVRRVQAGAGQDALASLEADLSRAEVVDSRLIPPDVVTMNSRVTLLDPESLRSLEVSVVFPGIAAPEQGRHSVLEPQGWALFG